MNYRLAFSGGSTINSRSGVGRKQHLGDLNAISKQPLIGAALSTSDSKRLDSSERITAADLYFTSFLVEHNLSQASADHFSKLCKKMFPDSKLLSTFPLPGRRSWRSLCMPWLLLQTTLWQRPALVSRLAFYVKVWTICSRKTNFGTRVWYWEEEAGEVVTRFLDMPVCNIAKTQTLFNCMDTVISKRGIPWSNAIGFASESESVIIRNPSSALSRVCERQPNIFSMACLWHLAALSAAAGLKMLNLAISIDKLLIDIYYHFKHPSKCCQEFSHVLNQFKFIIYSFVLYILPQCLRQLPIIPVSSIQFIFNRIWLIFRRRGVVPFECSNGTLERFFRKKKMADKILAKKLFGKKMRHRIFSKIKGNYKICQGKVPVEDGRQA